MNTVSTKLRLMRQVIFYPPLLALFGAIMVFAVHFSKANVMQQMLSAYLILPLLVNAHDLVDP